MRCQMLAEKRSLAIFEGFETEFRAGKEISGFAAVYYDGTPRTEYQLTADIIERVHKGAFDAVLNSGEDIFALYHHKEEMCWAAGRLVRWRLRATRAGCVTPCPTTLLTQPIKRLRRESSVATFAAARSLGKFRRMANRSSVVPMEKSFGTFGKWRS